MFKDEAMQTSATGIPFLQDRRPKNAVDNKGKVDLSDA